MRKLSILFMCMAFVAGMTAICQAETLQSGSGAAITITDAASGNTLTFTPSPNVQMSWNTAANEFSISSQNAKCTTENGLEYGIYSNYAGYWQRTKAVDAEADIGALSASDDTAFNGWTQMGGSS